MSEIKARAEKIREEYERPASDNVKRELHRLAEFLQEVMDDENLTRRDACDVVYTIRNFADTIHDEI